MTIKGKACIAGLFEHPLRKAENHSVAQLHAQCAHGALSDSGLSFNDVDGCFCAGVASGLGTLPMMGLRVKHLDTTEKGRSPYPIHAVDVARAIPICKCNVVLIRLAGKPRTDTSMVKPHEYGATSPDVAFERPFGMNALAGYAMVPRRHMYEYGTTTEQLAWVKVVAYVYAQLSNKSGRPWNGVLIIWRMVDQV